MRIKRHIRATESTQGQVLPHEFWIEYSRKQRRTVDLTSRLLDRIERIMDYIQNF